MACLCTHVHLVYMLCIYAYTYAYTYICICVCVRLRTCLQIYKKWWYHSICMCVRRTHALCIQLGSPCCVSDKAFVRSACVRKYITHLLKNAPSARTSTAHPSLTHPTEDMLKRNAARILLLGIYCALTVLWGKIARFRGKFVERYVYQ